MELLNLDSIEFIQTEIYYSEAMTFTRPHFTFAFHHPPMFSDQLNVPVYPSVHERSSRWMCAISLKREDVCVNVHSLCVSATLYSHARASLE